MFFFKMKKPLQAPSKSREHCFKITLWTSSGLSEVVAVTTRENTCNGLLIVEVIEQTWWQSSTLSSTRMLTGTVHSMDTTVS